MKHKRRPLLSAILFLFLLATHRIAAAQQTSIPSLRATALNGDPVQLPDALQHKLAVLVLGFSQTSRDQVTAWGKRLAVDYLDSPTVLYYEMPVLASVPRMLRGFIIGRIKSSVPLRAQPRFVPIDSKEDAWKLAAQYTRPEDAYVLVVDGRGSVIFRLSGPPTDASYATVRDHLNSAGSKP